MKIIDENGRLFGKISVIDIAVILVVAVVATAAYLKFNVIGETATSVKTTPTTYTVLVRGIRQTTADMFRPGDAVYNESGLTLGEVAAVETAPATTLATLQDGRYIISGIEERVDMTITVSANCSRSAGRFFVERTYELNVNSDYNLRSKYVTVYGTLMTIDAGE
jgi:FlaG/FlaF family flagellin (archaellin)